MPDMRVEDIVGRLEKATEGDVGLDALIFKFIGAPLPTEFMGKDIALEWSDTEGCFTMPIGAMRVRFQQAAYTSSIDAALTLVPEGTDWDIGHHDEGDPDKWFDAQVGEHFADVKSTPAIALCIAALKARISLRDTPNRGK